MIDWHLSYWTRLGEAEVDGNAALPLRRELLPSPVRNAAARGAEVKLDPFATNVRSGWTGDLDAFVFEVIDPKYAVAAAHSAVAGRSTFRKNWVGPVPSDRTAVTRAMKHRVLLRADAATGFSM